MANFPNSVTSFAARANGQVIDASHINDLQAEVTAIESGLINATAGISVSTLAVGGVSLNRGSLVAPSTRTGRIVVYPPTSTVNSVNGRVFFPDGRELSVANSSSAGLQEAINAASTGGFDLEVIGGSDFGSTTGGAAVYHIASGETLHFPAMQGKSITFGAVTLNFAGSGAQACVSFDSQMMVDVNMAGAQIVSNSRIGDGVVFAPSTAVPLDNVVSVVDSRFRFHSIGLTSTASTGAAVRLNSSVGGIDHSVFEFVEVNGANLGLLLDTPNSSRSVSNSRIAIRHLHGQVVSTTPQVRIGQSTTALIAENYFDFGLICNSTTKPGVEIWGQRNEIHLAMGGTNPSTDGVRFEKDAGGNQVFAGRVLGGISNNAGVHTNKIYLSGPDARSTLTVAASTPFTYTNKDCVFETLTIIGGNLSSVSMSVDGVNFDDVSSAARVIPLDVGQSVRLGFSTSATPSVARLHKGPTPAVST